MIAVSEFSLDAARRAQAYLTEMRQAGLPLAAFIAVAGPMAGHALANEADPAKRALLRNALLALVDYTATLPPAAPEPEPATPPQAQATLELPVEVLCCVAGMLDHFRRNHAPDIAVQILAVALGGMLSTLSAGHAAETKARADALTEIGRTNWPAINQGIAMATAQTPPGAHH